MLDPRYPIGPHAMDSERSSGKMSIWLEAIRAVPANLRLAVDGLVPAQLETRYREGGWTLRQVVHHIADSHLNAHARFRLALTEDHPTIRGYDEQSWAELSDARTGLIEPSLQVISGVHERWVRLIESLSAAEFERPLTHPEAGEMILEDLFDVYQWHGRHHIAHITTTRARHGW